MKSIKWIAVFLALLVCLSGCAGTHQSGGSYNIYLIAKSSTTDFAAFAPEKTAFQNSVVEDLAIR